MRCATLILGSFAFLWAAGSDPRHVTNGLMPEGARYTLEFSEDLSFGPENEGDEYIWALPSTSIAADSRGNIYIADRAESRVLMFDPQGRFLKTAARKGEGPGELTNLFNFAILRDGRGVAFDLKAGRFARLVFYDRDMNYLNMNAQSDIESFDLQVLNSGFVSPDAKHLCAHFFTLDESRTQTYIKTGLFDNRFNLLREWSSHPLPLDDLTRVQNPGYFADMLGAHLNKLFQPQTVFAWDQEGRLYTARSDVYEITRWAPDLKTKELVFGRKYKPVFMDEAHLAGFVDIIQSEAQLNWLLAEHATPSVIRRGIARSDPPPAKDPIFGIIPMEDGKVLAVHDVDLANGAETADIFSEEGVYLGQAAMKNRAFTAFSYRFFTRMIFRNGFAYTVETDSYGENRAVRYRYALTAQ